ncbi:putative aconitate hydratase [Aedoeadaptatus nemausensis]|uniref:Putative aconitate hydratase n=1 Tax=Aedoeadaptatus nemausensis TaxID=2582829 RepID=A0A6V6Y4P0_9FIRM|nr:aconitate hydratase [Peptoniphilus nemausensis]CAC9932342.1 putative aconitate hydratase [Peptoniphilus nemausensis]
MASIAYQLLRDHLLEGELRQGEEIKIKIDQTLTQDSTGTMVYLQLEAMDIEDIRTELSVAYIDHNMLQAGFENPDDHQFIQSAAEKYGLVFSKPGGGICHQVHLEQFARPGKTLVGSDSHTPTAGGIGSLAIGAGGLDVAVAMASGFYYLNVPKILNIKLSGKLRPGVNAKDVILTILGKKTVKGGTGYIVEYSGDGVKNLSVTDRATICNMGAELGATTSIFPADDITKEFMSRHGRADDFKAVSATEDAVYDEVMELDLGTVVPAVAKPHLPDQYEAIDTLGEVKVDQVAIGSCTNSSYTDMMKVAHILKGRKVHEDVSLVISPGSATILQALSENGALATMIQSGARILESACGPCIGMGQAPKSGATSLRSFNRNFKGRSGTKDAKIYLASPETCAASAIKGYIASPADLEGLEDIKEPESYDHATNYLIYPKEKNERPKETVMGPNIKPFPLAKPIGDKIEGDVLLKAKDNVTTDDICPSTAKLLPYRSNIPKLSNYAFSTLVDDFKERAEKHGGGIVVGGDNYGQGSSREHAALLPLYLGVKAIVAKSFARIHRSNLVNSGILPLVFKNPADYDRIAEWDHLELEDVKKSLESGNFVLKTPAGDVELLGEFSERERDMLLEGGYLNYTKNRRESQ